MKSQYANKETRDRLRGKSILCYGRCGKWKKVMNRRLLTVIQIEQVMDGMIKILKGTDVKRKEERPTETEDSTTTAPSVT